MMLAQLWPTLASIGGALLIITGIVSFIYWSKRARWEICHGTIQSVETTKHVDGETRHCPIITGTYKSKPFKITGNVLAREPEVGKEVKVRYDPKTNRYFQYSRLFNGMNILIPIAIGCVLLYLAWQSA